MGHLRERTHPETDLGIQWLSSNKPSRILTFSFLPQLRFNLREAI